MKREIAQFVIAAAIITNGYDAHSAPHPEDEVINMERITVSTGTRTERLASDAPIKTEFFLASEIKAHGGVTLADSLRLVPSARFESSCSNCGLNEIQLLGLSTDYTAILFDGAPLYSGLAKVYGADLFQQSLSTASKSSRQQLRPLRSGGHRRRRQPHHRDADAQPHQRPADLFQRRTMRTSGSLPSRPAT
ncbi:Plug domain-containing protein [Termitidicoccus mucosus]|uniref:Plug domain-containing protein n=1 Tax=Termitidicoccus mucosus TaxID=1184151 RepID=UPI003182FBBA